MVTGICKIAISIHGARSLKEKRKVLLSVKDKVKSRFNVSIAEVGDHDLWNRATLGICVVSADKPHADSQLQSVISFISQNAVVSDVATEFYVS